MAVVGVLCGDSDCFRCILLSSECLKRLSFYGLRDSQAVASVCSFMPCVELSFRSYRYDVTLFSRAHLPSWRPYLAIARCTYRKRLPTCDCGDRGMHGHGVARVQLLDDNPVRTTSPAFQSRGVRERFLPRRMQCRRGLTMRILSVRLTVCLSVR